MAREAEILVGGQAVLEGVMMKLPRAWAVTVRRADGELVSRGGSFAPWTDRWPVLKLPVLRGVATLGSMLVLGMRALYFSSDVLARDLEAAPVPDPAPRARRRLRDLFTLSVAALTTALTAGPEGDETDAPAPGAQAATSPPQPEPSGMPMGQLVLSLAMAFGMFLVLFKLVPIGSAWLLAHWFPALAAPLAQSLISGAVLVAVLLGYLLAISRLSDIRRVFQYHGAEHQVVHLHEAGQPHDVQHAAQWPTLHPRCGTSFLFFVVLTSVAVWSLFPTEGLLPTLGVRVLLLPLILGLSFELIRLSARHRGNWFFRALMAPGLWSQRITTRPPDDGMREVALRSLDLALVTPQGPSRP